MAPSSVSSCLRRDPRVPPHNSSNCTDYSTGGEFVAVSLAAGTLSTHSTLPQQFTANLLSNVVPQVEKFNKSEQIAIIS
jgi:DNA/RNA endonuclease G (NUC1)